jgi:type II secretory pathway component PulJ
LDHATIKSSLSAAQCQLVELLQTLNFGRIEGLHVKAGQPTFDPAPRVVQKLKMGGDNGPRQETSLQDFRLKNQMIEMLEALAVMGDGVVLAVEVKNGLPFSMEIEQPLDGRGERDA